MTANDVRPWSRALVAWLLCSACVAWAADKPTKPKLTARPVAPVALGGQAQLEVSGAEHLKFTVEGEGEGTVDAQGVFHAPAVHKTPAKVVVEARSDGESPASVKLSVPLQAVSISAKASASKVQLGGDAQVDATVKGVAEGNAAVKYELSGDGQLDEKGHYLAPKTGKTPATVKVKVSAVADPSKSTSVTLNLAPVAISAKSKDATVPLGGSTTIDAKVTGSADASVKYELTGEGTVDEKGSYSLPKTGKTPSKVTIKVVSVADTSKTASVTIAIAGVAVAAKAKDATVPLGGGTTLESKVTGAEDGSVKFELSGEGTVDEKGSYSAPKTGKTPSKVTIKVVSVADPSKSASVSFNIASVAVSAKSKDATVPLGGGTTIEPKVTGSEDASVKYELSGEGSVDDKGAYTAPKSGKTPLKATIKVVSIADPSKSASVTLNIATVAVSAKPPSKPVPIGGSVDLVASISGAIGDSAGVTWSVGEGKGAIDAKGHFTAPTTFKTPGTITVKATSSADPSKAASISVPVAGVSVALTPRAPSVELGGEVALTAEVRGADASASKVAWSVEGGEKNGTIDDAGHYKPPAKLTTPAKLTVKATPAADPSKAATVSVSIANVKLAAKAPKGGLALGGEVKLEAQLSGATGAAAGVSWKVETPRGGTIDADGTYHAPETLKTPATITVRATSDADPSKSAQVSLAFPAVAVKLPQKGAPVPLGGGIDLSAEVSGATGDASGVVWDVQGKEQGSIDAKGHYAPPVQLKTPTTITVRATSKGDPSKSATTQLAIPAVAVRVSPERAEVALGGSAKFAPQVTNAEGAAQNVTWSVVGEGNGTIDADGTYHAPASGKTPAKVKVRAVSVSDPSKSAEAEVDWPSVTIALAPSTGRVSIGEKLAFKATVEKAGDTAVEYVVEGSAGTIAPDGTYTAPAVLPEPPQAKVVARAKADPSKKASATVELAIAQAYSVASEQRISGGQPGGLLAGAPSRQRLALDDARVYAVYNDGQTLFVPSSNDRGATWQAPKKLLSGKFPIAAPQLAVAPDHTLWVAFRAQPKGQPGDVMVCRTPDLQHAFDPCAKANGKSAVANLSEHVLAIGPDGAVYVAWHDGAVVTLARSGNKGVSFSSQTFPAPRAHGLALAVAHDGTVFLAWTATDRDTDELDVVAGKDSLAPVKDLSVTGAHLEAPSLVALDAKHAALAYVETGVVKLALLGGPAAIVGAESGSAQDLPALALDGDGVQLVFRDKRQAGERILLARARNAFSSNKLELEPPLAVSTPGPAVRGAPSLAVERAGRAVVAWTDGRAGDASGTHQDLFAARVDEHPAQLKVTAPSKPLLAGESAQLQVAVTGAPSTDVRWSIDDGAGRGTIDTRGVYTAPTRLVGSSHVYVRATSVADPTRSAAALVELAPQPEITALSPEKCGVGELVTLTGHHFASRYPGMGVTFGGVRAREADYASWDDEKIAVRVPPGAKSGKVEVTAPGGTSAAPKAFEFLPVEISVTPAYAVVHAGQKRSFVASVVHAGDTHVTWALEEPRAGQLGSDGTLSVDAHADQVHRTKVRAVSVADPERAATAALVTGPLGGKVWSAKVPGAHGPALVGGLAIVTDRDGYARAYDRDGSAVWSTQVVSLAGAEGRPPQLRTPISAGDKLGIVVQHSGSCAEGRACLPDSGELVALDARTGTIAWRAELGDGDFTDAAAFPGGVAVARYAGALLAFKLDDGKKLWSATLPKGLSTPPVLGADGLLHGSGDGGVLYAVSTSGKAKPNVTFPGAPTSVSRPAVAADGTVYVASDDGQLRAIDARGQVRWTAALGGRVPPRTDSAPLLTAGGVFVATTTTLEAFDLSGARRWKATCGACSGPVLQGDDGTVYAGRYAPQAFSADGSFLWAGEAPSEGERWSPGALSPEGLLFWADAQGLSARIAGASVAGKSIR